MNPSQYGCSASAALGRMVSIIPWMWPASSLRTVLYASFTAAPVTPDISATSLVTSSSQSATTRGWMSGASSISCSVAMPCLFSFDI